MTATVETVSEQLDLAAIIPSEKVVSAVARAITLSESDVGTYLVFFQSSSFFLHFTYCDQFHLYEI